MRVANEGANEGSNEGANEGDKLNYLPWRVF